MSHTAINEPLLILVLAGVMLVSMLGRAFFRRIGLPGMVAFLLIGLILNAVYRLLGGMPSSAEVIFDVLGKLGVVALLFQAGLHTDLSKLVKQLRSTVVIWIGNVLITGSLGYAAARLIGLDLVPSIVVAVAMTATSVGVSTAVWEEQKQSNTEQGRLFLGVAGMDDISAIVLMALLFSIVPVIRNQTSGESNVAILGNVAAQLGMTLVKLVGFGALCIVFSRFVEHRMREALQRFESPAAALVSVVSVSFAIAAFAGLLGFSVAIGAFFAGLAFSRDPDAVRQHIAFDTIYDLFVPFFFIGIGLTLDLGALGAILPGLLFVLFAVAGKLLADGALSLPFTTTTGAMAVGVSMIPRAEVTMIVMQKARSLGDWAAPQTAYAAMVMVSLITTVAAPLVLRRLLSRNELGKKVE